MSPGRISSQQYSAVQIVHERKLSSTKLCPNKAIRTTQCLLPSQTQKFCRQMSDPMSIASAEIQLHDIKVHPGLTIEKSPLGGTGLMFEGSKPEGKVELLRIPYAAVIDNTNVLEVVEEFRDLEQEWACIVSLFQICQEASVLNDILIFFIVILWFFEKKRPGEYSQLDGIRPYLEILAGTKADVVLKYDEIIGDGEYIDHFLVRTMGMNEKLLLIYSRLCEEIPGFDIITKDVYFNLFHVVRSRILEIPHEVDPDSDDFTTNVSLVPIIDFANHAFLNNSYFDVDRKSKDILLYLEHWEEGKFEVTISYAPNAMVESFLTTYGFIPPAKDPQTVVSMELRISEYNALMQQYLTDNGISNGAQNYEEAARWLGIIPTCQLISYNADVFINQSNLAELEVLFVPDLAYDEHWLQAYHTQLQQYAEANGEEVEDEIAYLQYCLAHRDAIDGIGFVPVTVLEPTTASSHHVMTFMKMAAKRELDRITDAKPSDNVIVQQYLTTKSSYLEKLLADRDGGSFEKPREQIEAVATDHFLVSVNPPYPSHLIR